MPHCRAATLLQAASRAGGESFITPYAPVGRIADGLHDAAETLVHDAAETLRAEGKSLTRVSRTCDGRVWPRANKGFPAFKQDGPAMIAQELDF